MSLDLSAKIPSWISESFFQSISSSITKSGGSLKKLNITCATKIGDNFMGAVYRALLTYEREEISLIVKTLSESDDVATSYLVDEFVAKLFQTEMKMYEEVLPRVREMFKAAGYDGELSPR